MIVSMNLSMTAQHETKGKQCAGETECETEGKQCAGETECETEGKQCAGEHFQANTAYIT